MSDNEEQDELDRYRVPAKVRPRIFYFGIAGISLTASILLVKLLMCQSATTAMVEKLLNAQIKDIKERADLDAQREMQRVSNETTIHVNEVKEGIDSLRNELKTFKN